MNSYSLNRYHHLIAKYKKYKRRLDKAIGSGRFSELARYRQQQLVKRINKVRRQIDAIASNLRIAGTAAALGLSMTVMAPEADAQNAQSVEVVNTVMANNVRPVVDMDDNGNYVVAWEDQTNYEIKAQLFNSDGSRNGAEHVVAELSYNSSTYQLQDLDIAIDNDGDFVVAWNVYSHYVRLFVDGVGGDIIEPETVYGNRDQIAVAMDDDGDSDFVVAYLKDRTMGIGGYYSSATFKTWNGSSFISGPTYIETFNHRVESIDVAIDNLGNGVVVFDEQFYSNSNSNSLRYRRIVGGALGSSGSIAGSGTGVSHEPKVAIDDDGNFAVSWYRNPGAGAYIESAKFNSGGTLLAGSNQSYYTDIGRSTHGMSIDSDGDVVMAFNRPLNSSNYTSSVRFGTNTKIHDHTTGSTTTPDVASDADGDYVVVWQQNGYIYSQRFITNPRLALGNEESIDDSGYSETLPVIDMDQDGNYIIVWEDNDGLQFQVKYADETDLIAKTRITTEDVDDWDVAMNPDGDFIIYYESYGSLKGELYINDVNYKTMPTLSSSEQPSVGMDDSGNFAVAYKQGNNIRTRVYDPDGTYLRFVGANYGGTNSEPSLAMDRDGDIVVTWTNDGVNKYLQGRRMNTAGPNGTPFIVSSYAVSYDKDYSAVEMDKNGNFVVSWIERNSNGSVHDVKVRRFANDATLLGEIDVAAISTYPQAFNDRVKTDVAVAPDGDFLVSWSTYSAYIASGFYDFDTKISQFSADGNFVETHDLGPSETGNIDFSSISLAANSYGNFISAWNRQPNQGNKDIFIRKINSEINNDAPNDISLSTTSVPEQAATTDAVSTLSVNDPNSGDTHSFTIVNDPSGAFSVNNNGELYLSNDLDYETITSTSIEFQVEDNFGATFNETITIHVLDVDERPLVFGEALVLANENHKPVVAVDDTGDYVVVWKDSNNYLYAQRFNQNGSTITSAIPVDNGSNIDKYHVASDDNGTFVVLWEDTGDVLNLRHFKNDGEELSSHVISGGGYNASIDMSDDGTYVVVAMERSAGVGFSLFNTGNFGSPISSYTSVETNYKNLKPDVSMDGNGNFALVWNYEGYDGGQSAYIDAIVYKGYDNTGTQVDGSGNPTSDTQIVAHVTYGGADDLKNVRVNFDVNGDFVFGWEVENSGNRSLYFQANNSDGSEKISALQLSSDANSSLHIASDDDGDFTLAWVDNANELQMYRIDATGVLVETFNVGATSYQAISIDGGGTEDFVIGWRTAGSMLVRPLRLENSAPTNISHAGVIHQENQVGTFNLGALSTTDADVGDDHYYTLVAGDGDADNATFTINNGAIETSQTFDFETQSDFNVRVKSTDGFSSIEEQFTISITDANDLPTSIALDVSTINENEVSGTTVGGLSATDQDTGDTFQYELVAGTGDDDNTSFSINDADLLTTASFDFETKASYSIRIKVTDSNAGEYEEVLSVGIEDVNDAPVIDTNNGITIPEGGNAALGPQLSVSDQDNTDAEITYTVTAPSNGSLINTSNGGSVTLVDGESFDEATLAAGSIEYHHDGSETSADSFDFQVSDGTATLATATFNITISASNDAPTLDVNAGLTLDEGASASWVDLLTASDSDNSVDELSFAITAAPVSGSVLLNGSALGVGDAFLQSDITSENVTYQHDGSETVSDAFTFTVTDGTNTLSESTFSITVNPVNDIPLLETNTGLNVAEGGTVVLSSTELAVSDGDHSASELTFKITEAPVNGSLNFNGSIGVDETFKFSDLVDGNISYVHAGGENTSDSFKLELSDAADGVHVGSPFTLDVTVAPVNDAPILETNSGLTLDEGSSGLLTNLLVSSDEEDDEITYELSSVPAHGNVTLNGTTLNVGNSFRQSDLVSLSVSYVHNGDEATSDAFVFIVSDGTNSLTETTFNISVNPVNDAPTVDVNAGLTLDEGGEGTLLGVLSSSDPDASSELTYEIISTQNGAITLNGTELTVGETFAVNEHVRFRHDGSETLIASFVFTVSDGIITTPSTTFNVSISPVNDPPAINTNAGLTLDEGASANFIDLLSSSDPDNSSGQLTYELNMITGSGTLILNDVSLIVGDTFTEADIEAGNIIYQHDGNEETGDSFDFTVSDGLSNTGDATSFTISINPVNDIPLLETNTGLNVAEGGTVVLSSTELAVSDGDHSASELTFKITEAPVSGSLNFNGSIGVDETFKFSDLVDGNISYVHAGGENTSDSFKLELSDAADGVHVGSPFTVDITITAVNDQPTLANNTGATVAEGGTITINEDLLSATDVDSGNDEIIFTVAAFPTNGSLNKNGTALDLDDTFSLTNLIDNAITYTHAGGENSSDEFKFNIGNGDTRSEEFTFSLSITAIDDAPVIVHNEGLSLDEGAGATITSSLLETTDADTENADIVYTVTRIPENGSLQKSSIALKLSETFTQADVNNSIVTYIHDDSETTSDSFGFSVEDGTTAIASNSFDITINPVDDGGGNEAPTDIALSNGSIAENNTVGATIGFFSTTDPDTGDSHTYTIESQEVANALQISGNELKAGTVFNFEAKTSYKINVTTSDGTDTFTKEFTISITDVDDGENSFPTDISLSATEIVEGNAINDVIGVLSTTDPDIEDTHTYEIVTQEVSGAFKIAGSELQAGEVFDFATKSSYSLTILTRDNSGNTYQEDFVINIRESGTVINFAPTAITLTGSSIVEGNSVGDVIGSLGSLDENDGDTHTYLIISQEVAGALVVDGNELQAGIQFDFDAKDSYRVTLRTTDQENAFFEKEFEISVLEDGSEVNVAPTGISITNASIPDTSPGSTTVGRLSTQDANTADTFTYSIVSGDNEFSLSGDELKIIAQLEAGNYPVTVRSTDGGQLTVDGTFSITVQASSVVIQEVEELIDIPTSPETATTSNFRMISMPFQSIGVNAVFPDLSAADFGDTWKVVSWNPSNNTESQSNTFSAGRGYWFLALSATTIAPPIAAPASLNNKGDFEMSLQAGWNIVGNPFGEDLNWQGVLDANPDVAASIMNSGDIYKYSGTYSNSKGNLKKYEGAWVQVDGNVTLSITPPSSGGRILATTPIAERSFFNSQSDWQLLLNLRNGLHSTDFSGIGMRDGATEEQDYFDMNNPPSMDESLALKLSELGTGLAKNLVAPADNFLWNLRVGNGGGATVLEWDESTTNQLPNSLYLLIPSRSEFVNMKNVGRLELSEDVKEIRVLYGNAPLNGEGLFMSAFPNPAINDFTLEVLNLNKESEDELYELEIYGLDGKIKLTETFNASSSNFQYEVKNLNLGSGVYLYRVKTSTSTTILQKLIIN